MFFSSEHILDEVYLSKQNANIKTNDLSTSTHFMSF